MPLMDQMLDRVAVFYGYLGYYQISIAPENQEKTTFICPYAMFTFKRMVFG